MNNDCGDDCDINEEWRRKEGTKEMFYLTTHSTRRERMASKRKREREGGVRGERGRGEKGTKGTEGDTEKRY